MLETPYTDVYIHIYKKYNKTNLMYLSVFLIVISELYVFYIVIQLSILRMIKKNKNKIPQVVEVIMKASFIQWMQQSPLHVHKCSLKPYELYLTAPKIKFEKIHVITYIRSIFCCIQFSSCYFGL